MDEYPMVWGGGEGREGREGEVEGDRAREEGREVREGEYNKRRIKDYCF